MPVAVLKAGSSFLATSTALSLNIYKTAVKQIIYSSALIKMRLIWPRMQHTAKAMQ